MKVAQMTLALALVVGIVSGSYGYSGRRRLPGKRKKRIRMTPEQLYEIIKPYKGRDVDTLPISVIRAKAQLRALGLNPDKKQLPPKPVLKNPASKRQRTISKRRQSADKIEQPMLSESTPESKQLSHVFVVRPNVGGTRNGYKIQRGVMERQNEDGTSIVTIKGESVTVQQANMVFFDANNRADEDNAIAKISERLTAMSKHGGKISNLANGPAKPITQYAGSKAALANACVDAAKKQKTTPIPKAARKASIENNVRRSSAKSVEGTGEPAKVTRIVQAACEGKDVYAIVRHKVVSGRRHAKKIINGVVYYNIEIMEAGEKVDVANVPESMIRDKTPLNKEQLDAMVASYNINSSGVRFGLD